MRLLQVIDSLHLGGAEVLVKDIAPRFRSRGLECEVLVLSETSSPLETALRSAGVPLHSTRIENLYSLHQVSALARLMRGFDIVHVHLFPAQLWTVLAVARLKTRVPLVTTEHNTWNARRHWWLRPFDKWMYHHYQRIACNSQATADELIRWCPGIAGKTQVVPNGIPLETFANAGPAELDSVPRGVPRLVFVGRFEPQKDHQTILRALAKVPAVHLLLIGDGPLRAQLQELARALGVIERVTFLGYRNDIPQILKASDIYVHSTTSDGFGIAACEAMAAGLPVLASDVPGLAEVVGGAGVLFPMRDDRTLALELSALLSSPERRRAMSVASRQRAQHFSIERTVDDYIEMYRSVLYSIPQANGVVV
ncbi:MAG TPA: glycosyltransferase [Edaphobacter sp.]|jgi:glycosyltransferase involved in cell wall biosynthesis|nr:glycosyltransferase [Edaphobacter sp.]